MATEEQREAARRNLVKARRARGPGAQSPAKPRGSRALGTADQSLRERSFAFPRQRKEPLTDAAHVRNAIARFDRVEGVTDADRAAAWRRIKAAAEKFGVTIEARTWRELMRRGKTAKR